MPSHVPNPDRSPTVQVNIKNLIDDGQCYQTVREDVATSGFDSVKAHVHWVYCAYILLHMSPPRLSGEAKSLGDKQRQLQKVLENKEKRRVLQKLTQIGGVQRYKDELREALADA